jgi:hypothetical protein
MCIGRLTPAMMAKSQLAGEEGRGKAMLLPCSSEGVDGKVIGNVLGLQWRD